MIRAAWPNRDPTWTAFLEGGAVLRIMDADADNWLPRALRNAPSHWRYNAKPATAAAPTPTQAAAQVTAQTTGGREWVGDSAAGRPPRRSRAPRPTPPPLYSDREARATSRGRESGDNERGGNPLPPSPLTADC